MAFWDFVKGAGKKVLDEQPAAEAAQDDTARKVEALTKEVRALGLNDSSVKLGLNGDTVTIENRGTDRETLEKLILAVGNIEGIARVEANLPDEAEATQTASAERPKLESAGVSSSSGPVFHDVQKGDSLSAIAKKYLGDANKYMAIFEANKPMLTDPDKIYPGQKLRIPR
ncbi:MAG: peptidoglycan-binding protein LysM [Paracoccus sp. (in: a-proteobacteria)]|nr:peptidoglycan-binding protein LysM [Paracoccus sp. (in: a-proteobacteria)]